MSVTRYHPYTRSQIKSDSTRCGVYCLNPAALFEKTRRKFLTNTSRRPTQAHANVRTGFKDGHEFRRKDVCGEIRVPTPSLQPKCNMFARTTTTANQSAWRVRLVWLTLRFMTRARFGIAAKHNTRTWTYKKFKYCVDVIQVICERAACTVVALGYTPTVYVQTTHGHLSS